VTDRERRDGFQELPPSFAHQEQQPQHERQMVDSEQDVLGAEAEDGHPDPRPDLRHGRGPSGIAACSRRMRRTSSIASGWPWTEWLERTTTSDTASSM
jgi:hypothetical protein